MPSNWTLTIDLRATKDDLLLDFGLFSEDRLYHWRDSRHIRKEVFSEMITQISGFFNIEKDEPHRIESLGLFSHLATRSFQLEQFLRSTDFTAGDTLAINTVVTSIPWDLIPFQGGPLAHKVSLGLKIPSGRRVDPQRGVREGRPRFLHIVANPNNDLRFVVDEVEQLKSLVSSVEGLDYQLIIDPTPAEMIRIFASPGRMPFVHYSGHVLPKRGLLLNRGVLKIEEIVQYFPYDGVLIVFLNGCDTVYEEMTDDGELDLFQSASVANAFLDAGSKAVIAPRSEIQDQDACVAARRIWELVVSGEDLGAAVRKYRQEIYASNPEGALSYTYILYGTPPTHISLSSKVSLVQSWQSPKADALKSDLLMDAWANAAGPVAPRHIFAALTLRWIIGQVYFSIDGQFYIELLEKLRDELRVAIWPSGLAQGEPELTNAGRLALERAMAHAREDQLDELAFLEGLSDVDDPEIRGALQNLERGPRSISAILRAAKEWVEEDMPLPEALVQPNGFFVARLFLPGLGDAQEGTRLMDSINSWDLFGALILARQETSQFWAQEGLPADPPFIHWKAGEPLHWEKLASHARKAIRAAMGMAIEEHSLIITEARLMRCLLKTEALSWHLLPPQVRNWLAGLGRNEHSWQGLMRDLRISTLGWV
jgi:hypothetical protein